VPPVYERDDTETLKKKNQNSDCFSPAVGKEGINLLLHRGKKEGPMIITHEKGGWGGVVGVVGKGPKGFHKESDGVGMWAGGVWVVDSRAKGHE